VKMRGLRYKENEKLFALSLYYSSPKSYKFMHKWLCHSTVRSLMNWLQLLNVSCGLNSNILEILKTKFMSVEAKEKLVSIIIDEMSIKKLVSYNSKNDLFSGFEDFEDNSIINLKCIKYCD